MADPVEALAGRKEAGPRKRAADPSAIHDLFIARLEEIERRVSSELARPAEASGALQELLLDLARELWAQARGGAQAIAQPGALLAAWTAAGSTNDLGVDERLRDTVFDLVCPLSRFWLGLDPRADGAAPDLEGPTLLLFNRGAGPLPVEPLALWAYFRELAGASGRRVHVLWSPATAALPFLGDWLGRLGIFAASAENCRSLLERGAIVVAFPEGEQALAKTYEQRYRLTRFDAAFVVEAAVACGARIVPGAVLGNEESFPLLVRARGVPVTPLFPALGLFGLLPLPLKWRVSVGAPVQYGEDWHDAARTSAVVDAARSRMQGLLVSLLASRRTIFTG